MLQGHLWGGKEHHAQQLSQAICSSQLRWSFPAATELEYSKIWFEIPRANATKYPKVLTCLRDLGWDTQRFAGDQNLTSLTCNFRMVRLNLALPLAGSWISINSAMPPKLSRSIPAQKFAPWPLIKICIGPYFASLVSAIQRDTVFQKSRVKASMPADVLLCKVCLSCHKKVALFHQELAVGAFAAEQISVCMCQ